jgi:hypothetical protein
MKRIILASLALAACAEGSAPAGPATPASAGDASFDGRYAGTVISTSHPGCGLAGGQIVMNIANGRVNMRVGDGQNLVTARVNPGGSVSNVALSGPVWVGTSSGSGQITDGRASLVLTTNNPSFAWQCTFQYAAQRVT